MSPLRSVILLIVTLLVSSTQVLAQGPNTATRPIISELVSPVISISPIAADGKAGEAFLRKPPGDGPFPAVLLIHGGAPRWETSMLRDFALHVHASRFLEAGYVVVSITRRDLDMALPAMQEQKPVLDAIAIYDYVKALPYVDDESVVVRGTSVGGFIALEVSAARDVAATLVEEPFSFPFIGISLGPDQDQTPNTSKLDKISAPILLVRGDQTPNINDFNRDVFIPAVMASGKSLRVETYPGELHSFAFYDSEERTLHPEVSLQVFQEIDSFFKEHIAVQPSSLDQNLVQHEAIAR